MNRVTKSAPQSLKRRRPNSAPIQDDKAFPRDPFRITAASLAVPLKNFRLAKLPGYGIPERPP
jgi:hypothetical protein